MKKLRVMVLTHEDLVPPDDIKGLSDAEIYEIKTEYDVVCALEEMGHAVHTLGVSGELKPIRAAVAAWKPDVVFNLMEEFKDNPSFDQHVVSYLELLGVPYTGCNPRGLMISRDKALSKTLMSYHRIPTPRFTVFRAGRKVRRPKALGFPLFVKSKIEEASLGIAKASVVWDEEALIERVRMVHERIKTDAIAEEFIAGRELYIGIFGNDRLTVLPPQELVIKRRDPGEPLIATAKVKHDTEYQKRHGVTIRRVKGPADLLRSLERLAKRVYRTLGLSGYARLDVRLDSESRPHVLEANPNPEIARYEEFSSAAEDAGIEYEELLERVIRLGLKA